MRKIVGSVFGATGQKHHRHPLGTVVVQYVDGATETFTNVHQDAFEKWVDSNYSEFEMPWPIAQQYDRRPEARARALASEIQELEEEAAEWNEIEGEAEEEEAAAIHPADFIGQATGTPTPGFVPPYDDAWADAVAEWPF